MQLLVHAFLITLILGEYLRNLTSATSARVRCEKSATGEFCSSLEDHTLDSEAREEEGS